MEFFEPGMSLFAKLLTAAVGIAIIAAMVYFGVLHGGIGSHEVAELRHAGQ